MNPSTLPALVLTWLGALSLILAFVAKWIVSNGPVIATIIEGVKSLKDKSVLHDQQIAANTAANHATALSVPAPSSSPVAPAQTQDSKQTS